MIGADRESIEEPIHTLIHINRLGSASSQKPPVFDEHRVMGPRNPTGRYELEDKVALVTGAAAGVGRAIAMRNYREDAANGWRERNRNSAGFGRERKDGWGQLR